MSNSRHACAELKSHRLLAAWCRICGSPHCGASRSCRRSRGRVSLRTRLHLWLRGSLLRLLQVSVILGRIWLPCLLGSILAASPLWLSTILLAPLQLWLLWLPPILAISVWLPPILGISPVRLVWLPPILATQLRFLIGPRATAGIGITSRPAGPLPTRSRMRGEGAASASPECPFTGSPRPSPESAARPA